MFEQKVDSGTRLGTMILDHFIMTFGAMAFAIPGMIGTFSTAFEISHEQQSPNLFGNMSYVMMIGFAVYFCKDTINGRSPAKRILKLQVVDNKTGQVASPLKCFVRNIFCIIWPIEAIVALSNPSRRIGDLVAGTKVVRFDPTVEQPKPNWPQIGISLGLAYGLLLVVMLPFNLMMAGLESQQVKYIETSYNETDSNATEQLFIDSLGQYLEADIRVYDKIENQELKYVSVILRLKENYIADTDGYEELQSVTVPLLLSKFPEKTFVGRIQYVFQVPGRIQTRTRYIDWRYKLIEDEASTD